MQSLRYWPVQQQGGRGISAGVDGALPCVPRGKVPVFVQTGALHCVPSGAKCTAPKPRAVRKVRARKVPIDGGRSVCTLQAWQIPTGCRPGGLPGVPCGAVRVNKRLQEFLPVLQGVCQRHVRASREQDLHLVRERAVPAKYQQRCMRCLSAGAVRRHHRLQERFRLLQEVCSWSVRWWGRGGCSLSQLSAGEIPAARWAG